MNRFVSFCLIAVAVFLTNCNSNSDTPASELPAENKSNVAALSYSVVATYPHDTSSFTPI
jgi:glutamine cyclotransferase